MTGTQGATSVGKIQGRTVASTAPTNNQVLTYNAGSSQWEPAASLSVATNGALGGIKATTGKITLDGTGAITAIAADTAGSATNFSGSLAGDVSGTQGSTVVGKLQGRTVASTAPTGNQVLTYNAGSSQWEPATPAGGGSVPYTVGTNSGTNNTAAGNFATVMGGQYASAPLYGQRAYSAGRIAATGDTQESVWILRKTISAATQTGELFLDGGAATLIPPANSTLDAIIEITGRTVGGDDIGSFRRRVLVKTSAGGAVSILSSQVIGLDMGSGSTFWDDYLYSGTGRGDGNSAYLPSGWNVTVDNGGDGSHLRIVCTGSNSLNTSWMARVVANQLVY